MAEPAPRPPVDPLGGVRARREHFRIAMVELEAAISAAAPRRATRWHADVTPVLQTLRQAHAVHVQATEEPGGMFEQVRLQAPRLDGMIDRLADEHRAVQDRLSALLEDPGPAGDDDEAWVERMREDIVALLGSLSRHRQRGADLLYEAYEVDLGPGD